MLLNKLHIKRCGRCGMSVSHHTVQYYNFETVKDIYQVGYVDICGKCGDTANSYVDYYGKKKQEDLDKLHKFLIGGWLPMRDYSMLVNAGYY